MSQTNMCGIFCEIRNCNQTLKDEQILKRLENRGPDCTHSIDVVVNNDISIHFFGTVLWMQGSAPTKQPIENDIGILLFNGDIFYHNWSNDPSLSDTQILLDKLSNCSSSEEIISTIKSFKGPFSLIYFNKQTQILYFSRDRIGRNSLLFHKADGSYIISSVLGIKYPCIEIAAAYIYELNLHKNMLNLYSWETSVQVFSTYQVNDWLKLAQKQQSLLDEELIVDLEDTFDLNDEDDIIKVIEEITHNEKNKLFILEKLLLNDTILKTVTDISALLEKSVKVRIDTQPNKCKNCIKSEMSCLHCTTGILFSGGLDCTILSLIADKYVPKDQPIDLINVAFETKNNDSYDVPDRITGRQSFDELKRICSSRMWIFREVNVPKEKLEKYQASIIGDLVYPRRTILDESLGSALWFAALGDDELDVSPCRILLLGSGADELFGGYMRHRQSLKRRGWLGLSQELLKDWKRISFRNLARDNRVICDHGRQPRMPYLDEDLVNYVLKLKPWLKCFPSDNLECGLGDKLMLRLISLHLGLKNSVTLPKRALQFGSRIANKKEKGSDLSKTFI
ncbi:asparagine synthetase domain-containing protein CG17486 isoform X2 [Nymphalis io]|uniref:asparagine synthetase domain-containing protein CG17486 isoform X2 n=1 Tax=Inachis io TaxID=171585 RepID=UPI002167A630|nr:asparagine synthetase domain-containing protein CG17486 isoform X2 [Nymphalis io]